MAKSQTKQFLGTLPLVTPEHAAVCVSPITVEYPAAMALSDLIELAVIPAGVKVVDWAWVTDDLDSGGSPAAVFSLGVENAGGTDLGSEVWAAGLTTAQSGGVARAATAAAFLGDSNVDRRLALKCTTAPATYSGSGKKGTVLLSLQG